MFSIDFSDRGDLARLSARWQKRVDALSDESMKKLLTQSGERIIAAARVRVGQKGAIDTGRLRSAIGYRVEGNELVVGVSGLKYARINEFGGPFTRAMARAMFAAMRARGKTDRSRSKGYLKSGRYPARPYLGPSIREDVPNFKAAVIALLRAGV